MSPGGRIFSTSKIPRGELDIQVHYKMQKIVNDNPKLLYVVLMKCIFYYWFVGFFFILLLELMTECNIVRLLM